ncbi:F0F1 ATP synthase subunit B [Candidatus Malacoplasma girerdii]|uniref:ATP synthase subunit b n=1 Tax=Candidatus Malacoplasma girerdii TaxID=1318617 RepID=A0A097ST82_9BACT|nr:F0F1 ATP synthase subunit B [Candidatus Malacoplasma girerdii]ASJ89313.1 MAG: ATP synthase F0 sector subunit b [Candidatus Malacoplasma girerdii]
MKKTKTCLKILIILYLTILVMFFCTSCDAQPLNSSDIIDSLLPNLWVFLAHLLATVLLLIIIIWLVYKPTNEALKARSEYIQQQITDAENARSHALHDYEIASQTKIKAFSEAHEIIENAKNQAIDKKREIEKQAHKISEQIQNDAKLEANKIKNEMEKELHQKIVDIAFAASSALLKKEINTDNNKQFVDDFIKTIDKKKE